MAGLGIRGSVTTKSASKIRENQEGLEMNGTHQLPTYADDNC